MSNLSQTASGAISTPIVSAKAATIWLLAITAFVGLAVVYFVGMDEGMTSVFGNTAVVHEFFHDGRHFLGFPCH